MRGSGRCRSRATLSEWRDALLAGGTGGPKSREVDGRDEKITVPEKALDLSVSRAINKA
jgi:hypothetical protein